jgi:hypothetical protein
MDSIKKNRTGLKNTSIDVKIKLAARRTAATFLYAYNVFEIVLTGLVVWHAATWPQEEAQAGGGV